MASAKISLAQAQYELNASSGLTAYVRYDQSELAWSIKAEASGSYSIVDWDEPIEEDVIAELFFQVPGCKSFEDLAGVTFGPSSPDLRMLPDDAASFYRGYHIATKKHSIKFGEVSNLAIEVDWQFKSLNDDGDQWVNVCGTLPLLAALVWTAESDEISKQRMTADASSEQIVKRWQPDWDEARAVVSRFFPSQTFGEAVKWRGPLRFPIERRS